MMKKFGMMPLLALSLIMNVFCSCANKNSNTGDASIGCSEEDRANIITQLGGYLTELNDAKYMSSDLSAMVAQYDESERHEPWSVMWNTGSDVEITRSDVTNVAQKNDSIVRATCICSFTDGDVNFDETFYFDMKKENGKWVIYDIAHRDETARELLTEGIQAEEEFDRIMAEEEE